MLCLLFVVTHSEWGGPGPLPLVTCLKGHRQCTAIITVNVGRSVGGRMDGGCEGNVAFMCTESASASPSTIRCVRCHLIGQGPHRCSPGRIV